MQRPPDLRDFIPDASMPYGRWILDKLGRTPRKFLRAINAIREIRQYDCGNDWWLSLRTLLPAIGTAALVLLEFGWDDVARGLIRPYGIRTRSRLLGGASRFVIPELGETIGSKLPGARIIKAKSVSRLGRYLWVVDGLAQRALWYWMLADLAADTVYYWMSGLIKSGRCTWRGPGPSPDPGQPVPHGGRIWWQEKLAFGYFRWPGHFLDRYETWGDSYWRVGYGSVHTGREPATITMAMEIKREDGGDPNRPCDMVFEEGGIFHAGETPRIFGPFRPTDQWELIGPYTITVPPFRRRHFTAHAAFGHAMPWFRRPEWLAVGRFRGW